jgi:AcrR family transcriptional regulator
MASLAVHIEPPAAGADPCARRSSVCETRKARATQRRILDAAMRIIAAEGYHAAQNARIAEAAGVVRGVINYHFGDASGLLAAIVEFIARERVERLQALEARLDRPGGDPLADAIDGYWTLLQDTPFVAYAELEAVARTDQTLRSILTEAHRAFDEGVGRSAALGGDRSPDRQAIYDLGRFLLEGLAKGAMTYDQARREARLLRLLKTAVKAFDAPADAPALWRD